MPGMTLLTRALVVTAMAVRVIMLRCQGLRGWHNTSTRNVEAFLEKTAIAYRQNLSFFSNLGGMQ